MSKYFYDCEFLEGAQKKKSWWGSSVPTIDLISIGIVAEDGREYYAISKDFNLKEAWNRFDLKKFDDTKHYTKVYWIRENVLKPIFIDLLYKFNPAKHDIFDCKLKDFTYRNLSKLIKKYGKTNKQIAQEVKNFCYCDKETRDGGGQFVSGSFIPNKYPNIELYGYYSAYDHVALCWLFGKMIDLPTGFPMYTIDLKQTFDEKAESFTTKQLTDFQYGEGVMKHDVYEPLNYMKVDYTKIDLLKKHKNYPKQTNEHNSLSDAKFNFELYKFLNE